MSTEQGTSNKTNSLTKTSKHCSVPMCHSTKRKGISFHKLPNDQFQRSEWIKILRLEKNIENASVCSLHFKKVDYIKTQRMGSTTILKKNILPSQNLPKQVSMPSTYTRDKNINGTEDETTCMRKALFHEDTDAEFKFMDGQIIKFDKKLLCWCSKSPVFYQICFGPLSENVIEIKDFSCDTFNLFLNYIMGFNELTKESALEIFPIACKYLMTEVIEKCSVMLKPKAMNGDVCNLLNMAFFYNQLILCLVIKEFTMSQGSPYGLLENAKFSYLLSIDSFLEVIKWVTVDSYVLIAIVKWCDNFLKTNNKLESIKELLHEQGLIEHFKIDLFESGTSLNEFVESNLGKDIFAPAELCKYFIKSEYTTQYKSKWIQLKEGESFTEEFDVSDLLLNSYYNIGFEIGKIVTYVSPNLDLSCTITRREPPNQTANPENGTGTWVNDNKTFKFSLLSWYNDHRYSCYLSWKYEINYCCKQDCRIFVTNQKPRCNNKMPLYTDKFYFTTRIFSV